MYLAGGLAYVGATASCVLSLLSTFFFSKITSENLEIGRDGKNVYPFSIGRNLPDAAAGQRPDVLALRPSVQGRLARGAVGDGLQRESNDRLVAWARRECRSGMF